MCNCDLIFIISLRFYFTVFVCNAPVDWYKSISLYFQFDFLYQVYSTSNNIAYQCIYISWPNNILEFTLALRWVLLAYFYCPPWLIYITIITYNFTLSLYIDIVCWWHICRHMGIGNLTFVNSLPSIDLFCTVELKNRFHSRHIQVPREISLMNSLIYLFSHYLDTKYPLCSPIQNFVKLEQSCFDI